MGHLLILFPMKQDNKALFYKDVNLTHSQNYVGNMISFINLVLACLLTENTRENAKLKWFKYSAF